MRESRKFGLQVKSVWPRFMLDATSSGCKLVNLLPSHTKSWWPLVEDIFASEDCKVLMDSLLEQCVKHEEFASISLDGTVKCTMSLMGQSKPGLSLRSLPPATLSPEESIHTVLTVRGRSGGVVAMMPARSEKAEHVRDCFLRHLPSGALGQVKCIATDAPSAHLFQILQESMPQLQTMCLDPVHLAMKYEYATGRNRTPGSSALRACLAKFNSVIDSLPSDHWGSFYDGQNPQPLSAMERRFVSQISDGSMSKKKADLLLSNMRADDVWRRRADFIEALAAISSLYRQDVVRKSEKKSKRVYDHLIFACTPDRLEWLFNCIRWRALQTKSALVLMPSGTTSNEALHAEMRGWFRQVQSMHQSTLKLKCNVLLMRKLLEHNTALYFPTARQMLPAQVLARRLGAALWTDRSWAKWAKAKKASLPLQKERKQLQTRLAKRIAFKKPAAQKKPASSCKRRTPFNLPRTAGVIRAGVSKRRAGYRKVP